MTHVYPDLSRWWKVILWFFFRVERRQLWKDKELKSLLFCRVWWKYYVIFIVYLSTLFLPKIIGHTHGMSYSLSFVVVFQGMLYLYQLIPHKESYLTSSGRIHNLGRETVQPLHRRTNNESVLNLRINNM